jgi:hypothetical protein
MGVSCQLHVPFALTPKNQTPVPIELQAELVPEQSESFRKEKNLLNPAGIEQRFLGRPDRNTVEPLITDTLINEHLQ